MNNNSIPDKYKHEELSPEFMEKIRKELEPFISRGKELDEQEKSIGKLYDKVDSEKYSVLLNELLEKKLQYSRELENSEAFQKVNSWVQVEVYYRYVLRQLEPRRHSPDDLYFPENEPTEEELKAKREAIFPLLKKDPWGTAQKFMMLGSCHELWQIEREIFEELFDLKLYSVSELNPHVCFD